MSDLEKDQLSPSALSLDAPPVPPIPLALASAHVLPPFAPRLSPPDSSCLLEDERTTLDEKMAVIAKTECVLAIARMYEYQRSKADIELNQAITQRDRGLGKVQKQAITAAVAVFFGSYGQKGFPLTRHEMARAIADKGAEFEMELDPYSKSVQSVADAFLEAAEQLDRRDKQ